MEEFFSGVANFGFPVVVAGYLLMKFEAKLERLEVSISGRDGLVDKIQKLTEVIEGREK